MILQASWTTVNTILGSVSALIAFGLSMYAWSRTDVRGARIFSVMLLLEAVRLIGYTAEIASIDAAMALTAAKIQYVGVFVIFLWFIFTANFVRTETWFSRRGLFVLGALPAVILFLALTNEYHELIWRSVSVTTGDPFSRFQAEYGTFFYVYLLYTIALLIGGMVTIARAGVRRGMLFRAQIIAWMAGTLVPAFGQYSMVFGWQIIPNIHPIPLTYGIAALLLATAVFRLRLIDVTPIPFNTIFDTVPNEIIVYDKRRRVIAYNPAARRLADEQPLDHVGRPVEAAFPMLQTTLDERQPVGEIRVGEQDFKVRLAAWLNSAGQPRGTILILTDITAMKQAEREQAALLDRISRLEQLKSDMIRLGAHDLKDPLTTIAGYLDLIKTEPPTRTIADIQPYLSAMERGAGMIRRIVEDILSLDRIERLAQEQAREVIDVAALISTAFADSQPRALDKRLDYTLTLDGVGFNVCGDPVQLREAASNLIGNAIKYTPEEGQVRVVLTRDGESLVFRVTDTGYGIPESMHAKLFQPFFRAKTTETSGIVGTGLGLYLVKGIVERHAGSMVFESDYGSGSTFGFRLPLHNPSPSSA